MIDLGAYKDKFSDSGQRILEYALDDAPGKAWKRLRAEELDGHRDVVVVLTKQGRDVLESNRPYREFVPGSNRQSGC